MSVRRLVMLAWLGALGCASPASTECARGRVCPSGTVCDEVHTMCVVPEQLTACDGVAEADECSVAGKPFGNCRDGVCLRAGCGDGVRREPEQCDTTVSASEQACTAHGFHGGGVVSCTDQCTFDTSQCSGYCGDGQVDSSEACDGTMLGAMDCTDFGFQTAPGLRCSAACTYDVSGCSGYCGDNIKNGSEQCDGSDLGVVASCGDLGYYAGSGVSCTAGCTYDHSLCSQYCGDGIKNGTEACDGLSLGGQTCADLGYYDATALGCSAACTYDTSPCTGYCGDGTINGSEDCEPGTPDVLGGATCQSLGYYQPDGLACTNGCRFDDRSCLGYCGDRSVNGSEVCDGAAPPGETNCTDFGFESGPVSCLGFCGPDFRACHPATWRQINAGFTNAVDGSLAFAPNDVYLSGVDGIKHWNGSTWTTVATGVAALWGSGPNDIFGASSGGKILHWDGLNWTTMTSNTTNSLHGIWGASSTDVYAVGDQVIDHWDGVSWTPNTGFSEQFWSVWGSASNNVYAVAVGGGARRWDGGTWTYVSGITGGALFGVWGTSATDVFIVGNNGLLRHFNGSTWTTVTAPTIATYFDVWGTSSADVYAVGTAGTVAHYDGLSWSDIHTGAGDDLYTVVGSGPADVYAAGHRYAAADTTIHFDGGVWTNMTPTSQVIYDVYGISPGLAYAVGAAGTLLEWNGQGWASKSSGTTATLRGVWGTAADNLYTIDSSGAVRRWNGASWSDEAVAPSALIAIWGGGGHIFALGQNGTVMHYDGSSWTQPNVSGAGFWNAIWGSGPSDVYVVGGSPAAVKRWDGSTWNTVNVGASGGSIFESVWGTGPSDVYVGGQSGILHHFDGASWDTFTFDAVANVNAIGGTGPADVEVFLQSSGVRHFDGIRWSRQALSGLGAYARIGGLGDLFAATQTTATMLHRARVCSATETSCSDGKDEDCDGRYDCSDPDCAASSGCISGGLCAGWETISCNASKPGSTLNGPSRIDQYQCDASLELGPEHVYRLTGAPSGSVTVTLTSPGKDLDLAVLRELTNGSCEPRRPGCVGASSTTAAESVTFTADGTSNYFLVVDGFAANAGTFALQVSCP